MKEPVGLSRLFPVVPILNVISILLALSLIPSFVKAKIFTLMAAVVIIITGNLLSFVNMIVWRNNIRDIPIYSDIVAYLWGSYSQLLYINFTCFSKFVWYMSRPGSGVYLYDHRRKINRMDAIISAVAFLLVVPAQTFILYGRYGVFEDFGPQTIIFLDMKVLFINVVPPILAAIASIIFNVLTLVNVIIRRRKGPDVDATERPNPPIIKHLLHTSSSTLLMIFGNVWGFQPYVKNYFLNMDDREHYPVFVSFSEVMETKPRKSFYTRFMLDVIPDTVRLNTGFIVSLPLIGMYFFAFFGFGKEARKTYRDNIKWVARLLGWRQQDVERSGDSDSEQSSHFFFIQRKKFVTMFKRVFPRNRSRRIPVVPYQVPSDASSGHIEKETLDIRPTAPDQVNANRPQRRSVHKPRLHPSPRSSDTPIEDEEAQAHSLVASSHAQSSSNPPNLPSDSPNDIIQTGLHSLPHPQRKAPLPPPDRRTNSVDNVRRDHPQIVPLPVPPPAYSPETSRERQHLV